MTGSGTKERVLLAATCSEKSSTKKNRPSVLLVTQSRLILSPIPDAIVRKETSHHPAKPSGSSRDIPKGRHTPPHEPFGALLEEYRAREPEEILRTENDAREIPFEGITDVTFQRVRDALNHPRWISILLSPYDLGPASARYSVDYQIIITTPEATHTLLTPFLLDLKQVLVDQLGHRVHEIIDSNAPLL